MFKTRIWFVNNINIIRLFRKTYAITTSNSVILVKCNHVINKIILIQISILCVCGGGGSSTLVRFVVTYL